MKTTEYPLTGCNADWVNHVHEINDNVVVFDDSDVSGYWQIIVFYLDDDETRHCHVVMNGDRETLLQYCHHADSINWNDEAAASMSVDLHELCCAYQSAVEREPFEPNQFRR